MATVLLTKDEGVGVITVNRPEALNALNSRVISELAGAIRDVQADIEVKVVIITGAGEKAFVAGADIAEMQTKTAEEGYRFSLAGQEAFAMIEAMPKPVIAAVNGFALGGGCELAMACDIRLASENARFGQPEVNLGIIPGFGGTQRLPRLVGKGKAIELMWTGEMLSAVEAERLGLVNRVVAGDVLAAARELAVKIASKGQLAVRFIKEAVNHGLQADLATAVAYEASLIGLAFASEDQQEGMSAFLQKRKPQFKNR